MMEGKSMYDITCEICAQYPDKLKVGSMCTMMMLFQQVILKADDVEAEIATITSHLKEREEALAKRG